MTERHTGRTGLRTQTVGSLRAADEGEVLELTGWVHRRRDLGGLYFVDLRDRSGLLQVSFGPDFTDEDSLEIVKKLGAEDVVAVHGEVVVRPDPNPEMPTGEIELRGRAVRLLSKARTPEIPVYRSPEDELPGEDLRLRHRVLDLRRPELQANLALRHRLVLAVRNYLDSLGFLEIETPILTKPTPEGARDFLVPSRSHPGEFFALPQSPQIYKQVLMISGFDRYFQIARCFRDEALRADRQLEFTQIDVEASFVEVDDILEWMQGLMVALAEVGGREAPTPFPRITWDESMEYYGSDRPDLRWSLRIEDWSEALSGTEFKVLNSALDRGERLRGYRLHGGSALSRRQIEGIEDVAKGAGAPGLMWAKITADGASGPLGRFLTPEHISGLGGVEGDLILVAAGPDRMTNPVLDVVRAAVIDALQLPKEREDAWLWVTDFPVFEEDDEGNLGPNHHPFVMPHPEWVDRLEDEPLAARGMAYDLVYNGSELGSGSIRTHIPELQRRIFRILGMDDAAIDHKFGFLLDALGVGAPPHGGVAFGVDRIVQRFAEAISLRDVIAFPKTTAARSLFEGAPTSIDESELQDLHIRIAGTTDESDDA